MWKSRERYSAWRRSLRIEPLESRIVLASVFDYGATVNDSTYDHVAIQAAINANTDVFFPAGEYWINARLNIPAGRTLHGPTSGSQAVIRVRHEPGLTNNFAMAIEGNGVTIQNLTLDKDFVDGSYATGIYAEGRDDVTINAVEIKDYSVRYGIHLVETTNFDISNAYIYNFMMNQSNPSGNEADMVQDSPAGIRITRSSNGTISNSRIHNIEVGANGRASISELQPGFGPQGYQSDAITLSDSSFITVENNELWNSGELVDNLVSNNSTIRNNTMQMAWLFGVKNIGSQNSSITGNYIGDAATGIYMVDHTQTGEQATGNLIDNNDLVNNGSAGIWNIAASSRIPVSLSRVGILIDNNASGNTISNNDVYNFYGYLVEGLRQGTGSNTISNNNLITAQYGPSGPGNVAIQGSWVAGLTHAKEVTTLNRALVFFTYAEEVGANIDATAVTYGGRSMTQLGERLITEGTRRVYVSAWLLKQDAINTATSGNFSVSWNTTPDGVGYSSVFLYNINQTTPLFSHDSGGATSGSTMATSPRATQAGDIVLYGATAAFTGSFTPNNGFTEALEVAVPNADGVSGYKFATGANETASVTHTNLGTGAIYMVTLADANTGGAALLAAGDVAAPAAAEKRSATIGFRPSLQMFPDQPRHRDLGHETAPSRSPQLPLRRMNCCCWRRTLSKRDVTIQLEMFPRSCATEQSSRSISSHAT